MVKGRRGKIYYCVFLLIIVFLRDAGDFISLEALEGQVLLHPRSMPVSDKVFMKKPIMKCC